MYNIAMLYVQTSGKQINYNTPVQDHKNWVRAISINWAICDIYSNIYSERNNINYNYITPIGYKVDEESLLYNDITFDELVNYGRNIKEVLSDFLKSIINVDYIVGHNVSFHLNVIKSELVRNGFEDLKNFEKICLMDKGVNFCKIPNNKFGYKYPTLREINHKINFVEGVIKDNPDSLTSILEIYKYFFNNKLINIKGFDPVYRVDFIQLPFKINQNQEKFVPSIIKDSNGKFEFYLNDAKIYDGFDNIEHYEEEYLYLGIKSTLNYKGKKVKKRIVFDYRGIIIFEVFDNRVDIISNMIYIDEFPFLSIQKYNNGIFLHCFNNFKNYRGHKDSTMNITLYYINDKFQFLMPKSTSKIMFIGCTIFVNDYSEIILVINEDSVSMYDYHGTFINSFDIDYEVVSILSKSDYFLIKKNGKLGVVDLDTKTYILLPKYDEFISFDKCLFHFVINNKNILISDKGNIIYNSGVKFNFIVENKLVMITLNNSLNKLIYDLDGRYISEGFFDEIIELFVQDYSVYKVITENKKEDIIILNHKTNINPIYDDANFREGTIYYEKNELTGILNIETNLFLEPNNKEVYSIINSLFYYYYVENADGIGQLIDTKGTVVLNDIVFYRVFNHKDLVFVFMKSNEEEMLYNLNKNVVFINDIQKVVKIYRNKDLILAVKKNNKVNYINISNNFESGYLYDDLGDTVNFKENDREFYTNHFLFINDRLIVSKNNEFGFLDESFDEVIQCKFFKAEPFMNYENDKCLALVYYENDFYKIDVFGNIIT